MTPEEFVRGFYIEKKSMIDLYFDEELDSEVGGLINSLELDEKGKAKIQQIIDGTLTDAFYTVLLGLDGATVIGKDQILYKLMDEDGNELTGGEIEAHAYEYFHQYKSEVDIDNTDFIAELKYKSEGGRNTPALSGYRPQIKFPFAEYQISGQQKFIGRELAYPGDKVIAQIRVISTDILTGNLKEGMKFDFREGARVIGTGRIISIVNEKLRKR